MEQHKSPERGMTGLLDNLRIDFEVMIGDVSEVVTVQDGAPVLNKESAAVSTVVDHTFVDNLPLNGRSFHTLIAVGCATQTLANSLGSGEASGGLNPQF